MVRACSWSNQSYTSRSISLTEAQSGFVSVQKTESLFCTFHDFLENFIVHFLVSPFRSLVLAQLRSKTYPKGGFQIPQRTLARFDWFHLAPTIGRFSSFCNWRDWSASRGVSSGAEPFGIWVMPRHSAWNLTIRIACWYSHFEWFVRFKGRRWFWRGLMTCKQRDLWF